MCFCGLVGLVVDCEYNKKDQCVGILVMRSVEVLVA